MQNYVIDRMYRNKNRNENCESSQLTKSDRSFRSIYNIKSLCVITNSVENENRVKSKAIKKKRLIW